MIVALDTNVYVSAALFPGSVPRRAYELACTLDLIGSEETLRELNRVLRRTKLDKLLDIDDRVAFLNDVILRTREVVIVERVTVCRDPKDDMFLELLVNGQADFLVSGDNDLLALHPFRGIPILTPADFLAAVARPGP